jgi:hypothetical protein
MLNLRRFARGAVACVVPLLFSCAGVGEDREATVFSKIGDLPGWEFVGSKRSPELGGPETSGFYRSKSALEKSIDSLCRELSEGRFGSLQVGGSVNFDECVETADTPVPIKMSLPTVKECLVSVFVGYSVVNPPDQRGLIVDVNCPEN